MNFLSHLQSFVDEHNTIVSLSLCIVIGFLLIRRLCEGGWCYSKANLKGKTVIVTGANSGIGKFAAHDFAKRGARVILACRNVALGMQAAGEIKKNSTGEVIVRHLDLNSFQSIRKFARDVLSTETSIHILVNNAGVTCAKKKTEDGNDLLFQTNYLGPFLLTNLLLDKLKKSAPARIVNVSSKLYKYGSMNWDDLNQDKPGVYNPMRAYSHSKLALMLFTSELAKKLRGTGVNAYALHPGMVRSTEISRNVDDYASYFGQILISIISFLFAKSVPYGAQTTIYCAVAEELENESGFYYSECVRTEPYKQSMDAAAEEELWNISVNMVHLEKE